MSVFLTSNERLRELILRFISETSAVTPAAFDQKFFPNGPHLRHCLNMANLARVRNGKLELTDAGRETLAEIAAQESTLPRGVFHGITKILPFTRNKEPAL